MSHGMTVQAAFTEQLAQALYESMGTLAESESELAHRAYGHDREALCHELAMRTAVRLFWPHGIAAELLQLRTTVDLAVGQIVALSHGNLYETGSTISKLERQVEAGKAKSKALAKELSSLARESSRLTSTSERQASAIQAVRSIVETMQSTQSDGSACEYFANRIDTAIDKAVGATAGGWAVAQCPRPEPHGEHRWNERGDGPVWCSGVME